MNNRRDFIVNGSLALFGGIIMSGGQRAFGQNARGGLIKPPVFGDGLGAERFEPLINSVFSIESSEYGPVPMRLVEVFKSEGIMKRQSQYHVESFNLIFETDEKSNLQDGIYPASHSELGKFEVFISTVGRSGRRYQAVFSRVYF